MRGSIQIGRVFGIPLFINITWAPVFLLLVTFFATRGLPGSVALRGQPAWFSWALALSVGLVFAASLVAHELGHSVVARFFNVPVRGITLFVLGAVAQTSRESRRASHEFLMAAAGPAVSILLGGVFMVGWFITGMGRSVVSLACELLWGMNVLVGLFNLLPAYPMDGGRILRSAIWAVTGNVRRATHYAAWVGRGLAFCLIGAGIAVMVRAPGLPRDIEPFTGVQFVLIGLFINFAARSSDEHSGRLEYLGRFRVADVMLRDLPVALASTPAPEALHGPLAGWGAARDWLMVSDGVRFVGLAHRHALQALPEETAAPVGGAMVAVERLGAVAPDESLAEVAQRMDAQQTPVFVVVDEGQVIGVIARDQVTAVLTRAASRA